MPKKARVFSREMKLAAIRRMMAGESVSVLARELKLRRHLLYLWRDNFRAGGPSALRTRDRPGKSVVLAKTPVVATDDLSSARQRIAELERKVGQQQLELDFFSTSLAASRGKTPADRRVWRKAIYAVIEAMTGVPQGELTVARLRAGYYRHFRASAPRQEETSVCDAIQRIALKSRFYGYRRIRAELRERAFSSITSASTSDATGQSVVPEETAHRSCHDGFCCATILNKDSPIARPVHQTGPIISHPVLSGLHHQYSRI
jgi:transposase